MCTRDLFEAGSLPIPRASWATPTPFLQEPGSAAGPSAESCQGGRGHRPGAPAGGAVRKPQPPPLRARKEAAAEEGAPGMPLARLTWGRARPGLLSSETGLRGERR